MKYSIVFKTISWRVLGSLTTFTVAYCVDGSYKKAGLLMAIDTAVKTILFYIHEKIWNKIQKKTKNRSMNDIYTQYELPIE
jgi:uncharacterized membrane protein